MTVPATKNVRKTKVYMSIIYSSGLHSIVMPKGNQFKPKSKPGRSRKLSHMGFDVVVLWSAAALGTAERSYQMFHCGTPDK